MGHAQNKAIVDSRLCRRLLYRTLHCRPRANGSAPHVVIADVPGAQFPAIVYDDKVKQCGATWRIRWKFVVTTCSSAALTYILPMPSHRHARAIGKI